nr:RNA-binding protein 24-like [Ipomoea trifida]
MAPEIWDFLQMYDMASTVGTNTLSFGHVGSQPGSPGYTMMRGYFVSSSHMVQYLRPNVSGAISTYNVAAMQTPYYSGTITPSLVQSHTAIPAHSPRFTPDNNSEQASG